MFYVYRLVNNLRLARWRKPAVLPIALQNFLTDVHPKILDIGARSGPLREMKVLAPHAHFVVCEPDQAEAERVKQQLLHQWRDITIINDALAKANGTVDLHITKQPGLSSIIPPNQAVFAEYQHFADNPEYVIDHTITVPALTLEAAAAKYHLNDVALVKLDTQGSELEILQSGAQSALDEVVAIYVEVELKPFYTGQPMMTDVTQFLDRHGFTAIELKRASLRRQTQHRLLYSKREIGWMHCLYFRQHRNGGSDLTVQQKLRLVSIALAYRYFDYAMWLFEQPDVMAHNQKHYNTTFQLELETYSKAVWKSLSFFDRCNAIHATLSDRERDIN